MSKSINIDISNASSLSSLKAKVDIQLRNLVDSQTTLSKLVDCARYMLFPGGKRYRPLLALSLCQDLGGDVDNFTSPALALELVHVSSLIHDDLPALDNDSVRRGQPTCHIKFGEGEAVLAGDFLLGLSLQAISVSLCSADQKARLASVLMNAFVDLCHGQALDIISAENLSLVHSLKTGALFEASAIFGGIAVGLGSHDLGKLRMWAGELGRHFQMLDDYLDLFGTVESRGRPVSSDLRNQKKSKFSGISQAEARKAVIFSRDKLGASTDNMLLELGMSKRASCSLVKQLLSDIDARIDF